MDFLHIFHVALAAFLFLGWAVAPRIHAPVVAATITHWLTNGDRCILSHDYDDPNGFVKSLVEGVGLPWPDAAWARTAIPYGLVLVPLGLSIWLSRSQSAIPCT